MGPYPSRSLASVHTRHIKAVYDLLRAYAADDWGISRSFTIRYKLLSRYHRLRIIAPESDQDTPLELIVLLLLRKAKSEDVRRARDLRDEAAAIFGDLLHNCLKLDHLDTEDVRHLTRLLHDVCRCSGRLPISYWLPRVDTFRSKDILGWGGESVVLKIQYQGRVAVLRRHRPEANSAVDIQQIHREIIIHMQLDHPNILPLYGVCQEEQGAPPPMLMPYMENGRADKYLERSGGPRSYAIILLGCARGLSYLHSRNPPLVHGDIHPGNILVGPTGEAILCDFGFSRNRHDITRSLTGLRSGGLELVLAPELDVEDHDDFRSTEASDVYSLAMSFYWLGTGRRPLHDMKVTKAKMATLDGRRPPRPDNLGHLAGEITASLWTLMEMMWAHDPLERPIASTIGSSLRSTMSSIIPSP